MKRIKPNITKKNNKSSIDIYKYLSINNLKLIKKKNI